MMEGLATSQAPARKTLMIDAASQSALHGVDLQVKEGKLHAVTGTNGRPIGFSMTAGQVSGAAGCSTAQWMLAARGYNADRFRDVLQEWVSRPALQDQKIRNHQIRQAPLQTPSLH